MHASVRVVDYAGRRKRFDAAFRQCTCYANARRMRGGVAGTGHAAVQKLHALPPEALLTNLNLATMESPAAATYVAAPVLDGKITRC